MENWLLSDKDKVSEDLLIYFMSLFFCFILMKDQTENFRSQKICPEKMNLLDFLLFSHTYLQEVR